MKTLVHYQPLTEVRSLDDMFARVFGSSAWSGGARCAPSSGTSSIAIDVMDTADRFVIRAAVPGVKPENLDVQVEKDILTIKGSYASNQESETDKIYRREIATGSFERTIRLPEGVDSGAINAEFENGVVTIQVPHAPEIPSKSVKVKVVAAGKKTS